jgi:hypothetical protein
MKTQIFHHAEKYIIFEKSSQKQNQNPLRYYYNNSIIITNLSSFNTSLANYDLSKILILKKKEKKIDLLLLLLLLPREL